MSNIPNNKKLKDYVIFCFKDITQMKLYLIAGVCNNMGLGKDNKLAWKIPEDLKHFRNITSGHTVVMGRRTYESIGKPLPNRMNIVVTSEPHLYEMIDITTLIFCTLPDAEDMIKKSETVFIIGGESLYSHFLPNADGIYLTRINKTYQCDVFFPVFNDLFVLKEESDELFSHNEGCTFKYQFYEKRPKLKNEHT